jgi:hypothetical protein
VEYGVTTTYGQATVLDSSLATGHSVSLSGLSGGTQYHFRVISKDLNDNTGTSTDGTFYTGGGPGGTKVYPNPASLSIGIPITFKFSGSAGGEVKIYALNGKLVKSLTASSGEKAWDFTNQDGEKVAKGVYLYIIKDNNGDKITGKLAVTK